MKSMGLGGKWGSGNSEGNSGGKECETKWREKRVGRGRGEER